MIDQNTYLEIPDNPDEARLWQPFFDQINNAVIPNTADLMAWSCGEGMEVMFAHIACNKNDGRDRSLSQKKGIVYLTGNYSAPQFVPGAHKEPNAVVSEIKICRWGLSSPIN